jgi:hypothetical protein
MYTLVLSSILWVGAILPGDKGQRTYLDQGLQPTSKGKAAYYKEAGGQEGDAYLGKIFTMKGVLKAEGRYLDAELKVPHGHFKFFYPDGKIESEGDYVMGNKSGVWQRWNDWGEPMAEKVYNADVLANIIYTTAPTMPQYPGGEQAMVTYLKEKCGEVKGATANFVVETDGDLTAIRVSGTDPATAEMLISALDKAPRFDAGNKNGVPVRVEMRVPLK